MACFPRIDRPCPLTRAEQAGIGDVCSHCHHRVHKLDGMSNAVRRSLLANAGGPICVSYRMPASMAALALALALPAGAQELPTPAEPASIVATAQPAGPMSPVTQDESEPECDEVIDRIEIVGGISSPDDAVWLDDEPSSLPEVPFEDAAPDA